MKRLTALVLITALVLVQLPRLVEYRTPHRELADVVEQGRPPQPVLFLHRQAHLLREHVRVHAHAFGVSPCPRIVALQRDRQGQDGGRAVPLGLPVRVVFKPTEDGPPVPMFTLA